MLSTGFAEASPVLSVADPVTALRVADSIPDVAAIQAHIEMLHALAERGDGNGRLIVTAFGEDPDLPDLKTGSLGAKLPPKIAHFAIGAVEAMVGAVERLARLPFYNVYVALAVYRHTLRPKSRGAAKDIAAVLGLVADFDDADASRWQERLPLPPQLVLETSAGRFQCLYVLDEPQQPAVVAAIAKRLKAAAGCDHSTADVNHVWRIGGTSKWPTSKKVAEGRAREPQPVRVVKPWSGDSIVLADLDGALLCQPRSPITQATPPEALASHARPPRGATASNPSIASIIQCLPQHLRDRLS